MDLSLMAAVPHRKKNRIYFQEEKYVHSYNACCETLMKNCVCGDVSGKTILFVPFLALKDEGVTKDQYEKWLNCLKITGAKWGYSTLDKWVSLSSWNKGYNEHTEIIRKGVEKKTDVDIRYFEYDYRIKERYVPSEGHYRDMYGNSPETGKVNRELDWNEPGYMITVHFQGGNVQGELNRISAINKMARWPYFRSSDWQDKGYFMGLWEKLLHNNIKLDDWAKLSLSFLLLPEIDTSCSNSYFFPFGDGTLPVWPNTLKNFNNVGEGWNTNLCRTNIQVNEPWASYSGDSLRKSLTRNDLKVALTTTEDNLDYFIETVHHAIEMNKKHMFGSAKSAVMPKSIETLMEFINEHIDYDRKLEVGERSRVFTHESSIQTSIGRRYAGLF
jgi:hypothetical protein